MSLPTTKKDFSLTPAQLEALQSEDSLLRGTHALSILNEAIKETGVVIPDDYVFKDFDSGIVKKANNAVFGLIGGVPAMVLWASENKTEFYKLWAKQMPAEQNITGGGNVMVVTQVPGSSLDDVELGKGGFVQNITVAPIEEGDD